MPPSADLETRTCAVEDLRVESRGLANVIRGHAIVWGRLSENLGGFREQIMPEAIDRTFNEGVDLRALVDHDAAKIIGRQSAGTLRVAKDGQGLAIEIDPPEIGGATIVESIRRRDVTGMSFAFRLMPNGEQWDFKTDPPVRSIMDMLVREVSIVTWPAYPQTDVAMRSLSWHRDRLPNYSRVHVLAERLARQRAGWR